MKNLPIYILCFIAIILSGIAIFCVISHTVITNESIVLTFVGILATFVVVSNYAQVKNMKDELKNEQDKLNDQINNVRDMVDKIHQTYTGSEEPEGIKVGDYWNQTIGGSEENLDD